MFLNEIEIKRGKLINELEAFKSEDAHIYVAWCEQRVATELIKYVSQPILASSNPNLLYNDSYFYVMNFLTSKNFKCITDELYNYLKENEEEYNDIWYKLYSYISFYSSLFLKEHFSKKVHIYYSSNSNEEEEEYQYDEYEDEEDYDGDEENE